MQTKGRRVSKNVETAPKSDEALTHHLLQQYGEKKTARENQKTKALSSEHLRNPTPIASQKRKVPKVEIVYNYNFENHPQKKIIQKRQADHHLRRALRLKNIDDSATDYSLRQREAAKKGKK